MNVEQYVVNIGNVAFHILSAEPICWKESDKSFFGKGDAKTEVFVQIDFVNELPFIEEGLLYRSDSIDFYTAPDGTDVRKYRALFKEGHPLYAVSMCDGSKIQIYFLNGTDIWTNPNMRIWSLLHLESILLSVSGIVLHACYLMDQEQAILFTAPSGAGKTTQANLWKQNYNSMIVNGDKCLLLKDNTAWYACGFPYHGSSQECENQRYLIKAIVIVRQSEIDSIEEISGLRKLSLVYSECTVNSWDKKKVSAALDLLDDLCARVPVLILNCTMNRSAAEILHGYIYGEK